MKYGGREEVPMPSSGFIFGKATRNRSLQSRFSPLFSPCWLFSAKFFQPNDYSRPFSFGSFFHHKFDLNLFPNWKFVTNWFSNSFQQLFQSNTCSCLFTSSSSLLLYFFNLIVSSFRAWKIQTTVTPFHLSQYWTTYLSLSECIFWFYSTKFNTCSSLFSFCYFSHQFFHPSLFPERKSKALWKFPFVVVFRTKLPSLIDLVQIDFVTFQQRSFNWTPGVFCSFSNTISSRFSHLS